MAQQMPWSLLFGGLLILLIGFVGIALVVGIIIAWRHHLNHNKSHTPHPTPNDDAWQAAGQRLWSREMEDDPLADRLNPPGKPSDNDETDHLGMEPPSGADDEEDDDDDLPWKKPD